MNGSAFIMSGVTAVLVGWLAYRGSGHWWTGLAAGGTAWGIVSVAPLIVLAVIVQGVFGVPYAGTADPMVGPATFAANVFALGLIAFQTRPR